MSKTKLKHASYSIKKLIDISKLSFQTKSNYKDILKLCVKNLDDLGYQLDNIKQLKQKHICNLVDYWKDQYLDVATIKNRMSTLRYACRLLKKANVVFSNDHYDIGQRTYVPTSNKAIKNVNLTKINNLYVKQSLKLQQLFGLRREESIKFNVSVADKGDYIELKSSWTKGGIGRIIPVANQEQRDCLEQIKQLCKVKSLIQEERNFIEQRNLYDRLTHNAGLRNLHGLRHAYAQKRYFNLTNELSKDTGWHSPLDGGKSRSKLSKYEKKIDLKAREIISRELGHSRVAITKVYLG